MRVLLACLFLIYFPAFGDMDEHQKKGLSDTKRMLTNPAERNDAIKNDPKALEVDQKVNALTGGGKNKEEIYGIAEQVMEAMAQEHNGDPEKMQRVLLEAQKNPKLFYEKYFDAAQKTRMKKLASEIEKPGTSAKPPK